METPQIMRSQYDKKTGVEQLVIALPHDLFVERAGHKIVQELTDAIVDRYLSEHQDKVLDRIDPRRIAALVEEEVAKRLSGLIAREEDEQQ